MSILIKGMEMPTSCTACRFRDGVWCRAYPGRVVQDAYKSRTRDDDCPLIPVPPHGDLVDAQEQMRLMQSCEYDTYDDYNRAFDMLDNAPTIIPASEEGE